MLGSVDVKAAEPLLMDVNGDGVITADEINDMGAFLSYGLTTGYHVCMPNMTGAIEGSEAYEQFMAALGDNAAEVVMGALNTDANNRVMFKAAEAFSSLVSDLYQEFTDISNVGYTIVPAMSHDDLLGLLYEFSDMGSMSSSNFQSIYNTINAHTFDNDLVFIQRDSSTGVLSSVRFYQDFSNFIDNYIYKETRMYYAYLLDDGSWSNAQLNSATYNISKSKYTTSSSNYIYDGTNPIYFCVGRDVMIFNSLADCSQYYDLRSSAYIASDSPQSVVSLALETLKNTDWSNLSNTLWQTFETEVKDSQALGVMAQSDFQQILDDNFTALDESIGAANEGSINSESLDKILEQITADGERQTSWLAKIYALLEAYLQGMVENDPEVESPTDSSVVEKLEEQKEVLENNAKEQLEQDKLQHEENKTFFGGVTDFFDSFFDNLIDSIVGIFIPDDETMSALFDELEAFFEEKFGFLYYTFDFLTDLIDVFINTESGSTGLTLPGFEIMGYTVWEDTTYDLTSEPVVGEIFGYVRVGTGVMLSAWFLMFLSNFFDKRFGGGGN